MTKKEKLALGLNLGIPGGGQFALKRYLRGIIILLGCIITSIWAVISLLLTAYHCATGGDGSAAGFYALLFKNIALPISLATALFLYSFIDIIIFKNPTEEQSTDEPNNAH